MNWGRWCDVRTRGRASLQERLWVVCSAAYCVAAAAALTWMLREGTV